MIFARLLVVECIWCLGLTEDYTIAIPLNGIGDTVEDYETFRATMSHTMTIVRRYRRYR